MEQVTNDDFDYFMIQIKKKIFKRQVGMEEDLPMSTLIKRNFGLGFEILIPQEFDVADEHAAARIFWSEKRSPNIMINKKENIGFTFQMLEDVGKKTIGEIRETIRKLLEQIDERIVFYDQGKEKSILWFEYKGFARNKVTYNMVFLFQAGTGKVLGSFFCPFEEYDRWKPVVIEILNTVEKEGVNEGI